jgi:hypothetical protein
VAGRIRSIEKSNDFIGNLTRDLPACSVVLQPTTLPRAPVFFVWFYVITIQTTLKKKTSHTRRERRNENVYKHNLPQKDRKEHMNTVSEMK